MQGAIVSVLRVICYFFLAALIGSWLTVNGLLGLGLCDDRGIEPSCSSGFTDGLFNMGLTAMVTTFFLGLPFLLGAGPFIAYDGWRLFKAVRSRKG